MRSPPTYRLELRGPADPDSDTVPSISCTSSMLNSVVAVGNTHTAIGSARLLSARCSASPESEVGAATAKSR
jgi:hypothetical protein